VMCDAPIQAGDLAVVDGDQVAQRFQPQV
jgi:hypothetical protein